MSFKLHGPSIPTRDFILFEPHFLPYGSTIHIRVPAFRRAFGLKPREERTKVEAVARRAWPILELIARDAIAAGEFTEEKIGPVKVSYTIDPIAFERYAEKYGAIIATSM